MKFAQAFVAAAMKPVALMTGPTCAGASVTMLVVQLRI